MTTIRTTKRVETLLSDKKINSEANDYRSYGRTLPGHPAPLFGQQYKFGKAEALKLSKSITTHLRSGHAEAGAQGDPRALQHQPDVQGHRRADP